MPMKQFTAATMLEIFDSLVIYLKELNINKLIYKTIPHIYHRYPAEEDIYALFRHNAEICECNISSTAIPTNNHFKYSSGQSSLIKRNCQKLEIIETKDFAPFWTLLTKHLKERYDSTQFSFIIDNFTMCSQATGDYYAVARDIAIPVSIYSEAFTKRQAKLKNAKAMILLMFGVSLGILWSLDAFVGGIIPVMLNTVIGNIVGVGMILVLFYGLNMKAE